MKRVCNQLSTPVTSLCSPFSALSATQQPQNNKNTYLCTPKNKPVNETNMRFTHKQIWVITFPILVSLLMEHLINMTDTAFLGRVGEVELGASALAGVYYMAIYMLAFGFSIGAQILIGRRNGEGNYKDIGPHFYTRVLFLVGLATLMFTVSRIYTPSVLRSVIDSEQVYVATNDYMKWRVFGFFFSFVAVMFRAFFVGITTTRILTINSLVMVGTNVVLNYLLIFGKFRVPRP